MLRPSAFILPAQPTLRDRPPKGDDWLHEVKFDGYRVQLHKHGKEVVICSRNGIDFTTRFPAVATALAQLPTRTAIIDAEVVAVTAQGLPDFAALLRRTAKPEDICCYCFDLLRHNSLHARLLPLVARRARLEKILGRFGNGCLLLSETFSDPDRLLAECETLGLEGIVSKRKDAPYRSGKGDWVKVKTKAWRVVSQFEISSSSRRIRSRWLTHERQRVFKLPQQFFRSGGVVATPLEFSDAGFLSCDALITFGYVPICLRKMSQFHLS